MKDYLGLLVMWKVIPFLYIKLIKKDGESFIVFKFSTSLGRYFSEKGVGV